MLIKQSWGNLRAGQQTAQQGLTHGCVQIGLVLLCTVIHFVAGQIIEYLADKERGALADSRQGAPDTLVPAGSADHVCVRMSGCGGCAAVPADQEWLVACGQRWARS